MLLKVLESIDHAQALPDGTAEGHVIDHLVANDASAVDEKEPTVGHPLAFDLAVALIVDGFFPGEHIVSLGNRLVDVGDQGIGNPLDATLFTRGVEPGPVGKLGIGRAPHDCDVAFFELSELFLEAEELGRTNEGEILGIEEEDDIFLAEKLVERKLINNVFTLDGFGLEGGGFLTSTDIIQ